MHTVCVLRAVRCAHSLRRARRYAQGVEAPPISFVAMQMRSVLSDIGADALKSGMLPSRELAGLVAAEAAAAGLVRRRVRGAGEAA